MPLTANCDVFAAIHDEGINRVAKHIMQRRPSLFNYATPSFIDRPELLCSKIDVEPAIAVNGDPIIGEATPWHVPGTQPPVMLEYCVQLLTAQVDFHPGGTISLPPQIGTLDPQSFAIHAAATAGVGVLDEALAQGLHWFSGHKTRAPQVFPSVGQVTDRLCFKLELFVAGLVRIVEVAGEYRIVPTITHFEIVNITPDDLETVLEYALKTFVQYALFPKLTFSLETLTFQLMEIITVHLKPAAAVPTNPAIEDHQLKTFVDVEII